MEFRLTTTKLQKAIRRPLGTINFIKEIFSVQGQEASLAGCNTGFRLSRTISLRYGRVRRIGYWYSSAHKSDNFLRPKAPEAVR